MAKRTKRNDPAIPPKHRYEKPVLTSYGSVRNFTRSGSSHGMVDGGAAPLNKMMMCIGPVSALEEHRLLIGDRVCQGIYRRAIFEAVRDGDTVLDLGTGSGIHAMFACQAGARKVYAIDADTVISLAEETANRNGFGGRIEFLYGDSQRLSLPTEVDVIISNVGFLGSMQSLPDACARFLKPGGRVLPSSVELSFVPVTAPGLYGERVEAWSNETHGFDFTAFRPYAASHAQIGHFTDRDFLSRPAPLAAIDLAKPIPAALRWEAEYVTTRSGILHGLAGWYSFDLGNGNRLSTRPPLALAPRVWAHPFLPLEEPRRVRKGAKISVSLGLYLVDSEYQPIWTWKVVIDGKKIEQTSFDSIPLETRFLEKLSPA